MSQQENQEPMAKKYCNMCGGKIDRDSQFCYLCGAKQPAAPGTPEKQNISEEPKVSEEPKRIEQPVMPIQPQYSQQSGSKAASAGKSRTGLLIGVASVAVLLLGVIIGMVVNNLSGGKNSSQSDQYADRDRESSGSKEPDGKDREPAVQRSWTDNVLMAAPDTTPNLEGKNKILGNSNILRDEIISVDFLNTLAEIPDGAEVWDVSADGSGSVMAWAVPYGAGYNLYIGAEGGMAANADCRTLFEYYTNVETIRFNGNFHTQNVETMGFMFSDCESLTSVDVGDFDTSNVTDMKAMFQGCESLTSVDVSGFDTSKVEDMSYMFSICRSLRSIDVSGFDTSNVTDMRVMFQSCEGLTSVDVSGFNTSKVEDMAWMFNQCESLRSIDVSGFDTSRVTDMSYMFNNCESFTDIDVRSFDTSNVTDMSYMFAGCTGLTDVDISGFDVSRVWNFECMFAWTSNLTVHISGSFPDDQISAIWGN